MHNDDRAEPFYRLRAAVIPVLLLGAAGAMLAWHAREMWTRDRCGRVVELHEAATALGWEPEQIRTELTRRFGREQLVAWTSHPASGVRRASAWAVGYVGRMSDCEQLVEALQHHDPLTASAAGEAIWRLWLETGLPVEAAAELRAARRLLDDGRVDEALRRFNRLIIRWPDVAESYNQRARVFMIRHEYGSAMKDCRAALARNRFHFDALARLGECYFRLGDRRAAMKHYREAVGINPNLRSVWRRLARLREAPFATGTARLSRT